MQSFIAKPCKIVVFFSLLVLFFTGTTSTILGMEEPPVNSYLSKDSFPMSRILHDPFFGVKMFFWCTLAVWTTLTPICPQLDALKFDEFTKALWKSQAEFLLGKLGVLNIHSNLRQRVEDQTNEAIAPIKSTKSDPINLQNQMQKGRQRLW